MLSFGTARASRGIHSDTGILFWSQQVDDVMGLYQARGTELMLGDGYCRINFGLQGETSTLDGTEHLG